MPLVELRTTNEVRYYTDSNGVVAFQEPALMGKPVFFHVWSHGYEYPKDGFGFRGQTLQTTAGGSATIKIKRQNIAERLYRITGGDIYRDSVLVGKPVPIQAPLLNAQVVGSDGGVNVIYRSKIYWFWGDTNRPKYPLGNFNVPGAVSALPGQGGFDPSQGVDFNYFVDDQGFARPMAPMPGDGPTWIDGLVALKDDKGAERLFASYVKVRGPLTVYARGLAEYDDAVERFRKVADFTLDAPGLPGGQPFIHNDGGVDYAYFAKPFPLTRVRATPHDLKDLSHYEMFTCLKEGSRLIKPEIDRAPDGRLIYAWKRNTPIVEQKDQKKLAADGLMKPNEGLLQLRDSRSG